MDAVRAWGRLVYWDWVREMKRKDTLTSMVLFSLVTLFILSRAIEPHSETGVTARAGILWVTLLMAGAIGIDRAFRGSDGGRVLEGLLQAPVGRTVLYWAKLTSTFLYLAVMELVVVTLFCLLYGVPLGADQGWRLGATVLGVTVGFVAVGVSLSAMTRVIHGGDVLLRILLFALLIPLFWAAVEVTDAVLARQPVEALQIGVIAIFDVVYLAAGQLLFEPILRDWEG